MPVVSVKVEESIKQQMAKYREQIDWPDEIRRFIGGRLQEAQRQTSLAEVETMLKGVARVPKGTAARLVREDRDRGH